MKAALADYVAVFSIAVIYGVCLAVVLHVHLK